MPHTPSLEGHSTTRIKKTKIEIIVKMKRSIADTKYTSYKIFIIPAQQQPL
jgi:hypothetical protein